MARDHTRAVLDHSQTLGGVPRIDAFSEWRFWTAATMPPKDVQNVPVLVAFPGVVPDITTDLQTVVWDAAAESWQFEYGYELPEGKEIVQWLHTDYDRSHDGTPHPEGDA